MSRLVGSSAAVRSNSLDPPDLTRRYRLLVGTAVVAVCAFAWWLSSPIGSVWQRRVVSDVVFVVAPVVAALSAGCAHRRRRSRHTAWAWISAGCWIWALASVVWSYYGLVLGRPAPFPSLADIGYIFYAGPIAVGLTQFPNARGSLRSRVRLVLDAAVMTGCLLLTSAVWVLAPIVDATSNQFVRADALAYPLADVTIAVAVLCRGMVFSQSRRLIWTTLGAGLLVEAFTDSVYVSRTFAGTYRPGHLLDLGWLICFVLVALAAQTPVSKAEEVDPGRTVEPPSLAQQLVPYGAVALAVWSLVARDSPFQPGGSYFWATLALVALIVVRQIVDVADQTAVTRDLSAAVQRRTADIEHREQWWRDLVQNLTDVVIVLDADGAVQYCSPSVSIALGHWPHHILSGEMLLTQIHPDDVASVTDSLAAVMTGERRHGYVEARVLGADQQHRWFEISAVGQLAEKALHGTVLTLHDVTERHRLTARLTHQAFHDTLTELPNRAALMARLDDALSQRQEFALALIDLDDFKLINDSHGHAAGDSVLSAIGKRLLGAVRSNDFVARLGGDEFAVILFGSLDRARTTAQRVSERIGKPVVAGGRRFLVNSSIGLVAADPNDDAQTLLSHADIALYEAKGSDRGGIVAIEGGDRLAAARKVHLREQIAQPKLDQFSVVYQPIVDLNTRRLRGVEALLRWTHPEHGPVSPADFVPLAEHGGSIHILGWYVLETALEQLAKWQAASPSVRLGVGVNVSVQQLDEPDFAARVLALVQRFQLQADQLVLELTEQALARDFETAVAVVAELRRGGVSVAVDDYGTGYSSLRYLHRFDADVVKIDRSFIANLPDSEHTQKIVRSVVQMAESLDLQCIAEGIETPAQLEAARALGCELGQGYLFARPARAEDIAPLIDSAFEPQLHAARIPRQVARRPASIAAG